MRSTRRKVRRPFVVSTPYSQRSRKRRANSQHFGRWLCEVYNKDLRNRHVVSGFRLRLAGPGRGLPPSIVQVGKGNQEGMKRGDPHQLLLQIVTPATVGEGNHLPHLRCVQLPLDNSIKEGIVFEVNSDHCVAAEDIVQGLPELLANSVRLGREGEIQLANDFLTNLQKRPAAEDMQLRDKVPVKTARCLGGQSERRCDLYVSQTSNPPKRVAKAMDAGPSFI
jgi:hypothetical protein